MSEAKVIRAPKDFWSGAIFVVTGLAAVILARQYSMGSATRMGPGYFPTVLGGLLVLIGLACIVRSLLRSGEPVGRLAWMPVAVVSVSTLLFGVLLRGAGLAVALIVLVIVSAWGSRFFRWGPAIALAIGLAVFCILVFVKALGLPIPIIGPWLGA